ncbi:hypothetical protein DSO57_1029098 [Entomophthora muscae]|uniref:Uncharacterized protein n=1 Tax=Entomophthora muscae TaxID=34485 RepID=A0ACC2RS81_9FUNG|nr:hypothetical protein DSO57_1029098 [Entomophthora muscae]
MLIQYKPGAKLVMADALSRLYVCASRGENGLGPDWSLLVLCTKDKGFPEGITDITKEMVIKNEHLFADVYRTLHRKMLDGTTIGNSAHVDTKNVDSGHVYTFNVDTIVK